jgi:ribosomal protein S18 acetylase RimI-like enzyme
MPQMNIRHAGERDLALVYQFEQQYIEAIEPENLTRWLAAESRIKRQLASNLSRMFIADDGGAVVGHCFWDVLDGQPHICSIFVVAQQRRTGLASRLIGVAEADCKAHGFATCLLETRENNPAQEMFLRLGYVQIAGRNGWLYFEKHL